MMECIQIVVHEFLALFPGPRPTVVQASYEKLGAGLGTRLDFTITLAKLSCIKFLLV